MMKKDVFINEFAYKSDIGKLRLSNQDKTLVLENESKDVLMLVADGMGGQNKGDYAAKLASDYIAQEFKKKKKFLDLLTIKVWLLKVVSIANRIVYNASLTSSIYNGMGTTLVLALIHHNNIIVINIGDSRAYMYKDKLKQLSLDDSYVAYLSRVGKIKKEDIEKRKDKNVLINALGIYPTISFNMHTYKYKDEHIVLCSDGLYNSIKDNLIIETIQNKSANEIVSTLIALANKNSGSDNISVAYFRRKYL